MECIPGPGTKHVLIDFERYRTTFEFRSAPNMSKKSKAFKLQNIYKCMHFCEHSKRNFFV